MWGDMQQRVYGGSLCISSATLDVSRTSAVSLKTFAKFSRSCKITPLSRACVNLPGHLPGVATPVLLKHLCSHRVSRTSVLKETHPRLFLSLQTILETVHGTCIHCVVI